MLNKCHPSEKGDGILNEHCAESGVWQGRWGCSQALPGVTVSLLILFTGTPGAGADSTVSRLNRHPPKQFPQKAQTSIPRPFGLFPQDLPAASEGVLILLLYQALFHPGPPIVSLQSLHLHM